MNKRNLLLFILLFTSPLTIQNLSAQQAAPNIDLQFQNSTQPLNSYQGKLVYLDFWASWCIPCRKSFPWMNAMHNKYKDKNFELIAINLDSDPTQVSKFLEKYPAQFKVAYDAIGKTADRFNVKTMPSSFLIDRNGNIIFSHAGFRTEDAEKLEKAIQSNL